MQRGVTIRSVGLGLALAVGLNLAAPYVGLVVRSQYLATSYFPVGLGVGFFVLVLGLNSFVGRLRRGWALSGGELAVVFVMGAVATTMPTHGIAGKLLSFISAPHYLASPENRWGEYLLPHLPRWAIVGPGPPLRWFYEGLPAGERMPWGAWVLPLGWWVMFLGAAWFACLCLVSLFRRQWMDHERLSYPLAEMALALIARSDGRPRSRLFKVGFFVAFGTLGWNIVGHFVPGWPLLPSGFPAVVFGREFPGIPLVLYWPMVCIAFFLRADVSLSLWVFVVLGVIEEGVLNRLGVSIQNALKVPCFDASRPALSWQSYGAMLVMVASTLWVGRRHWRAVVGKALRPARSRYDDSADLLPARAAIGGLAFCALFMTCWLWRLGMRPGTALLFLVAGLVGFIGLSRLVVEGGLVFILPPLTPQSATVTLLGNSAMGARQLAAMGLSMGWIADPINAFMPAAANADRVARTSRAGSRTVAALMMLAVGAGLAATVPMTLWLCYRTGAHATGTWLFHGAPYVPYGYAIQAIRSAPGVEWAKLGWGGAGAGLMAILTVLHHRLPWWPLHPIGLVVGVIFKVRWCFLPLLTGWLAKVVVLRVGGAVALGRAKDFFLGAMVGWFAAAGLSVVLDVVFFPGEGHVLCWH